MGAIVGEVEASTKVQVSKGQTQIPQIPARQMCIPPAQVDNLVEAHVLAARSLAHANGGEAAGQAYFISGGKHG